MKEAADTEKFSKFADAHRKRLYNKMLAPARRRCGDPNWAPTGMLSGGGMRLNIQVERQARKLYRRIALPKPQPDFFRDLEVGDGLPE
jgi:hypothetical protein